MPRLAFYTIGILHEPWGHPRVQGFVDRIPTVFEAAEAGSGFVDRSRFDRDAQVETWGDFVMPRCFPPDSDPRQVPATLSLWTDLESVAAFAYHGAHGEAMGKRREWFQESGLPGYVAWWVPDGHQPDWAEAAERVDHFAAHGPTPYAFDFKRPFDADGRPASLDRETVRRHREGG